MPLLIEQLRKVAETHEECSLCEYVDGQNPCVFCPSPHRDPSVMCVVAESGDVWTLEKTTLYKGRYHVLGELIAIFQGNRAENLRINALQVRLRPEVREAIVALDGTLEGHTTLHYIAKKREHRTPHVSLFSLARGMPVVRSLEYTDQGILRAFIDRRKGPPLAELMEKWFEKGKDSLCKNES